jgi:molybdopterin molybdotransferase
MTTESALISVEAALTTILDTLKPVAAETIALNHGLDRILAEAIRSEIDVPPFANSAMDGYALLAADTGPASAEQPVYLKIIDNIPAGVAPSQRLTAGTAARIMTGAPLPAGADAVVRFEETSEYLPLAKAPAPGQVAILQRVTAGDNVREAGEDVQRGQIVLAAGHRIRPQDVGVLAAIGQAEVRVYRRPRVAILATGDELVDVTEPIGPGQIRNSNEYTQAALVERYGGQAVRLGIARDTVADLTAKIQAGLAQNVDLFLTSAGVSVGDFDMVKDVLASEGEMQFWQVTIKPGKPLVFGVLKNDQSGAAVPLIGLPGNPVAAMVAFEVFARPAILKLGGWTSWEKRKIRAVLAEEVINSGRRHYMRAYFYPDEQDYGVTTRSSGVRVQGSGILTSLVWANGLVVVPEEVTYLPKGALVDVWILD